MLFVISEIRKSFSYKDFTIFDGQEILSYNTPLIWTLLPEEMSKETQ